MGDGARAEVWSDRNSVPCSELGKTQPLRGKEVEEDEAGEESRSQITENILSFDDYLGDVNLEVFTTLYSVTPAGLSKDFF